MLGTCCRTWAPSAPSTVPPPSAATIQLSPPAANLTCMPGVGGTDLPADVLVLPASRRLHITGRVQRPARGSSTHACPSAHYRRTGIRRADLCAPHWTPTRSRDTTAPEYRMSSREHTGMVDLGADGDPRTHRVISKESAIRANCNQMVTNCSLQPVIVTAAAQPCYGSPVGSPSRNRRPADTPVREGPRRGERPR
jgi:hypothetical protein